MEAPQRVLQRAQRATQFRRGTIALGFVLVLLAVIVPCAVLLPSRPESVPSSSVLLPLYIYPTLNAWNPLYHALEASVHLKFTVVINPQDGPGPFKGPGDEYVAAIKRLVSLPNAQVIGYVRVGYAKRNITSVLEDIAVYSYWPQITNGLAVSGIFFDEAPHEYAYEARDYMRSIDRAVKDGSGILKPRMVVHNPGAIPDDRYNSPDTDVTVVFEQSYAQYRDRESRLSSLPMNRSRYAYLVHSVPLSNNMGKLLDGLSRNAEYLFVSSLDHAYYESFAPDWTKFIHWMSL